MSSMPIRLFKRVPIALFRLNAGGSIKLRDLAVKKRSSYDVLSQDGVVRPKALNPTTYTAPNGASMRPFGDTQTKLVQAFKGKDVIVYEVPQGTSLPDTLLLVHEHSDHYSLQPAREMTVEELNQEITRFLQQHATVYTKEQWLFIYRDGWQWSEEHQNYFRYMADGSYEWYQSQSASSSNSKEKASKGKETASKGKETSSKKGK